MDGKEAQAFAEEWVAAWNARDLDRILSHYAEDVVFLTPRAVAFTGSGRVAGIPALRDYWGRALQSLPNLKFGLVDVYAGYDCLTIQYRNDRGQNVTETMEFDAGNKVVRSFACYVRAD